MVRQGDFRRACPAGSPARRFPGQALRVPGQTPRSSRSVRVTAFLGAMALAAGAATADGLTDEELIARAESHSGELASAQAATQQSEVMIRQARSRKGPQLSGSLDFSYITNPIDPVIVRTGEFGSYDVGGTAMQVPPQDIRVYEGMEPTLFQLEAVLEQPVFTWGKLDLGVELANRVYSLREAQERKSRQELALEIVRASAAVRHLDRMTTLAEKQVELTGELVQLVSAAFDSGAVVRTDVLEAQVGQRQAELALAELSNQLDTQIVTLRQLVGMPDLEPSDLSPPRFGRGLDPAQDANEATAGSGGGVAGQARPAARDTGTPAIRPADDLVQEAVSNSAGLLALERAGMAAETNRRLAELAATARPDFGLRLNLTFSGPRVPLEPDWYGRDEFNLVASIGLQSTLYDGGVRRGDARIAELDAATTGDQIASAQSTLEAEVRKLALTAELTTARIAYRTANAALLNERSAVRQREFDAGVGGRDGVVRAELDALSNELETATQFLTLEASIRALEVLCGAPVAE